MLFDMFRVQASVHGMAVGIPVGLIAFARYVLPVGQVSYWFSSKIYGE
ncbi:hypothetical protein [Paracoccus sp. (in: a-proteobacteria)]|jgi:hypothetical protein